MIEQDLALGLLVWEWRKPNPRDHQKTGATCVEWTMATWNRFTAERFWARVIIRGPNECWPWVGNERGIDRRGRLVFNGRGMAASRIAWCLWAMVTPPKHLFVCHKCNNPKCCNPSHLYLGTRHQNILDAVAAGTHARMGATHCPNGHERTPENTVTEKNGCRRCRKCKLARMMDYHHRNRETVLARRRAKYAEMHKTLDTPPERA